MGGGPGGQGLEPLLKVADNPVGVDLAALALGRLGGRDLAEVEPVVPDDLVRRPILEVVDGEVRLIGAALSPVGVGLRCLACLLEVVEEVEVMDVHLGRLAGLAAR